MRYLSWDELIERQPEWLDSAWGSPGIDAWCSSPLWNIPATGTLMPDFEPAVFEDDQGFFLFARGRVGNGIRLLCPLESSWGLCAALTGPNDCAERFRTALQAIAQYPNQPWDALLLGGLPHTRAVENAIVNACSRLGFRVAYGERQVRDRATLREGFDGWLGGRSAKFRKNLGRVERQARSEGVDLRRWSCHTPKEREEFFGMAMGVESRSWKGLQGAGVNEGRMKHFVRALLQQAGRTATVLAWTVHREDEIVAYCFGGIHRDTYRGYQLSFDQRYARFGLGNLMQLNNLRVITEEFPEVDLYDLGSTLPYKSRWADSTLETRSFIVYR